MANKPRYEVDERGGCIAVIDTTIEPPSQGLHEYSAHVVWFHMGEWTVYGPMAGGWNVPQDTIDAAHVECARLNAEHAAIERMMHT